MCSTSPPAPTSRWRRRGSVDDQLEWLDDRNLLYHAGDDIWTVPADGSGTPRRYLAHADSPAVVR